MNNVHQNNEFQVLIHSKGFISCRTCDDRIKSGNEYIIDKKLDTYYCSMACLQDAILYGLAYSI